MALEKEYQYFKDHQANLVAKYFNKYIVIAGDAVEGPYESDVEALTAGQKKYPIGTFLVQHCLPGNQALRQTFHSRVKIQQPPRPV